jgi:hypothetical protein
MIAEEEEPNLYQPPFFAHGPCRMAYRVSGTKRITLT